MSWEKDIDGRWICPHNRGVSCENRDCCRCGWNPEVAEKRTERILAGLREETPRE